jgi:hypothetical protein
MILLLLLALVAGVLLPGQAWVMTLDLDGNRIELWQPPVEGA